MSKKDKKIEIQITDSKVKVGADQFDGYSLAIGKRWAPSIWRIL